MKNTCLNGLIDKPLVQLKDYFSKIIKLTFAADSKAKASFRRLGYFSVLCQFGFAILFVGLALYSSAQVDFREQAISNIREEYPWIDQVAWVTDSRWVPSLFSKNNSSPSDLLNRIYEAQEKVMMDLEFDIRGSNDNKTGIFTDYLYVWSERVRFCQLFNLQTDSHYTSDCLSFFNEKLPDQWLTLFKNELFDRLYFSLENRFVRVSETETSYLSACNFAPYSVRTVSASSSLSGNLVDFYNRIGLSGISDWFISDLGEFKPGECIKRPIIQYDRELSVLFDSRPLSTEIAQWVDVQLSAGRDLYRTSNSSSILLCKTNFNGFSTASYENPNCASESLVQFSTFASVNSGETTSFQALTLHPALWIIEGDDINGQFWSSNVHIADAKLKAVYWASIAETQFELDNKWRHRDSHFLFPADISNHYGALSQGVYFENGQRVDMYKEDLEIPSEGLLLSLNDREIWSVYDIYEALDKHGHSRSAGIAKPIKLAVYKYDGEIESRYFFNKNYLPDFLEETSGLLEGFMQDITYGQEWIACGGENILRTIGNFLNWGSCKLWTSTFRDSRNCMNSGKVFALKNVSECSWRRVQQYAFASQTNPIAFEIGRISSLFVPVGTTTLKLLKGKKLAKASKFQRSISYGVAEALDNAAIEMGTRAPGAPFSRGLDHAAIPAGIGFVSGALFHP